ncbi:MAG: hypothetical protein A2V70_10200, partial [Planctomycetes bacterium RBG_13_63_9]
MARENQGLQIALIIFVMLTIILGVTTFIFFRQYEEANQKAEAKTKEAFDNGEAAKNIAGQCISLKQKMGFASDQSEMKIDEINTEFETDMETYAGTIPEEKRNYHDVLAYLNQTVVDKNVELAALKIEVQDLKDKYEVREASHDVQIKKFQDERDKAGVDLVGVTTTAKDDRDRLTKAQEGLNEERKDEREAAAKELEAAETKLGKATELVKDLETEVQRLKVKLEEKETDTFETPDGEIRWVNQHNRIVWIDLGRADSLGRQTTFSVYPAEVSNLAKAGKKADIEVTRILGEHLAVADIVEDSLTDPILPGDRVYTPLWSPGEQRHFALTGFIDLDEDGKSDCHVVVNLIKMSGGVVDCWTDEKGEIQGKMTVDTRYLVNGADPSEVEGMNAERQAAMIKANTEMVAEADRLRIKRIALAELLQQMGYKDRTP